MAIAYGVSRTAASLYRYEHGTIVLEYKLIELDSYLLVRPFMPFSSYPNVPVYLKLKLNLNLNHTLCIH
jgi:hypothetical protein